MVNGLRLSLNGCGACIHKDLMCELGDPARSEDPSLLGPRLCNFNQSNCRCQTKERRFTRA